MGVCSFAGRTGSGEKDVVFDFFLIDACQAVHTGCAAYLFLEEEGFQGPVYSGDSQLGVPDSGLDKKFTYAERALAFPDDIPDGLALMGIALHDLSTSSPI